MNTSILSHKSIFAKVAGIAFIAGLLLSLALLGGFAQTSLAAPTADITVDGTTCTLADAITAANTDTAIGGCSAGSGADTLTLTNDISLTSVVPAITSIITIEGGGHTISGSGGFAILTVGDTSANPGTLTLNEATITGGTPGIQVDPGSTVTVNRSTITGNGTAAGPGGGIVVTGATGFNTVLMVNSSTISNNSANIGAGIQLNTFSSATVVNSTISNNSAALTGGGINVAEDCTLTVQNSTISANSAAVGAGINHERATVTVQNSIVAAQNSGGDCFGAAGITSLGFNIESSTFCGFTGTGDQQSTDPLLEDLADNGGPTQTHFPQRLSPILDTGSCSAGTDQRGFTRPHDLVTSGLYPNTDNGCDIGAVEAQDETSNAISLRTLTAESGSSGLTALWTGGLLLLLTGFGTLVGVYALRKRSL